jgi:hypothetical protein
MAQSNYTMLSQVATFQATDQRDLIYAFFGLFNPVYWIVLDYSSSNSITHVLIQVAKSILDCEPDLGMLSYALATSKAARNAGLPKWVPDWLVLEPGTPQIHPSISPTVLDKDVRCQFADTETPGIGMSIRVLGCRLMLLAKAELQKDQPTLILNVFHALVPREFSTSSEGYVALASPEAQAGDDLWLLNHGLEIYVLRPRGWVGAYVLVGQARLYLRDSWTSDAGPVKVVYANRREDGKLVKQHYQSEWRRDT